MESVWRFKESGAVEDGGISGKAWKRRNIDVPRLYSQKQ